MESLDADKKKETVLMAEQADKSVRDAFGLLKQICLHNDWECEEQDQINEYILANRQKAKQIGGYTDTFCQAVKQSLEWAEGEEDRKEDKKIQEKPDKKAEPKETTGKAGVLFWIGAIVCLFICYLPGVVNGTNTAVAIVLLGMPFVLAIFGMRNKIISRFMSAASKRKNLYFILWAGSYVLFLFIEDSRGTVWYIYLIMFLIAAGMLFLKRKIISYLAGCIMTFCFDVALGAFGNQMDYNYYHGGVMSHNYALVMGGLGMVISLFMGMLIIIAAREQK